jgi:hypothetical protein
MARKHGVRVIHLYGNCIIEIPARLPAPIRIVMRQVFDPRGAPGCAA